MKMFARNLLLAVLVSGVMFNTAYSEDKALRKEVESLYAKVSNLMIKKDVSGIAKMLTDDCTFIDGQNRTINRQQWETSMKQQMAIAKNIKCSFKVLGIKTKGNSLLVSNSWDVSMDIPGQDGKTHKLRIVGNGVDTLVEVKGAWKLKKSKADKERQTLDGKPITM